MTDFIKQLTREHITIMTLLYKVKSPKLSSESRASYLTTIKSLIEEHFLTEDQKLYPKLKDMASAKNNAMETIDQFTVGLDKIGSIITNFFNDFEKNPEFLKNNSDLSKIIALLEVRINKEERGLYTLYNSLIEE